MRPNVMLSKEIWEIRDEISHNFVIGDLNAKIETALDERGVGSKRIWKTERLRQSSRWASLRRCLLHGNFSFMKSNIVGEHEESRNHVRLMRISTTYLLSEKQ